MLTRKNKAVLWAAVVALGIAPLTVSQSAQAVTTKTHKTKKVKTNATTLPKRTAAMLERINGKPLTDAQKAGALKAQNEYSASMKVLSAKRDADFASALGMTTDEYAAKAISTKPAKTATTAPATTPAATAPAQ